MNLRRVLATAVLALAAAGTFTACSTESQTPAPAPSYTQPAAPVAEKLAPKSYTLHVSGTVKPQQVTWSFDGSSGGGKTVPFEKVVTAQADTNSGGTVGAVSGSGTSGSLTCSVVDNATGQAVDTKTAESDGSEYSYASVMCAIPMEMGTAYAPGYSSANGEVNPGGNGG